MAGTCYDIRWVAIDDKIVLKMEMWCQTMLLRYIIMLLKWRTTMMCITYIPGGCLELVVVEYFSRFVSFPSSRRNHPSDPLLMGVFALVG
jgi:hypothetical protein